MKNSLLDQWCKRSWIKVSCCITAVITIAVLIFWNEWSSEIKIIAGITALIPIHVVEEWVFPGGFHYQYNSLFHSEIPDRYPMSRLSDMVTNFFGTIFFVILTLISIMNGDVNTGVILALMIFCILEAVGHTAIGTLMYFKFKDKGKTTIYGPGSITAYLGFGVFGVLLIYSLKNRNITSSDLGICAVVLFVILVVCIFIPEGLTKRKDSIFFFEDNGYFERFLK